MTWFLKKGMKGEIGFSFVVWVLFFLLLWQLLLSVQNPGLMSDDSGEMVAAAYRLGLPHPPGYPFFNLVGHLFSFLPVGTPAFRLNLLAGCLTLGSLFLILRTCRLLGGSVLGKGLFLEVILMWLGLVYLSSRSVFAQSLTAKGCVYLMTLLFASFLIWARVQGRSSNRMIFLLWFLWAVGMSNHWQTQILCIPLLIYWSTQVSMAKGVKDVLYIFTFVLLGISIYLYLPIRAVAWPEPCWGYPANLTGFYWVVSRQLVKGVENWIQPASFYFHSAQWVYKTAMFYWMPGLFILAIAGFWALWRKKREFFFFVILYALPILLAVGLIHEERNQYLVPVYLLSLSGVMILTVYFGLIWFFDICFKNRRHQWILVGFLWAAAGGWLSQVHRMENRSHYTLAEDFGANVLKGLPRNALLLADGDHYVMSIWYQQRTLGLRPDVIFEPSVFLYHGWGWKHLADRSEKLKKAIEASPLLIDRLKGIADKTNGHPLFYSLGREYLEKGFERIPGRWVARGLSYEWMEGEVRTHEKSGKAQFVFGSQRFRNMGSSAEFDKIDFSTRQIYRYYLDQYYLTTGFRESPPQAFLEALKR